MEAIERSKGENQRFCQFPSLFDLDYVLEIVTVKCGISYRGIGGREEKHIECG